MKVFYAIEKEIEIDEDLSDDQINKIVEIMADGSQYTYRIQGDKVENLIYD